MSDYRDIAAAYRGILSDLDPRALSATFTTEDDDGLETETLIRLCFAVCPTCEGRGAHVAPGIDAHGLTAEDFADDPDFAEDYHAHRYDQPCAQCDGARVVPEIDRDANDPAVVARYDAAEAAAWQNARDDVREREMGY